MSTTGRKRINLRLRLQEAAEQRVESDLVRHRHEITQRKDARVLSDGQRLLNFSGNDYLGLAHHPAIVSAMQVAAQNCGVGAGASHLVCGHHSEHSALERALADWLGYPRALLFGSGYLANLAIVQALMQPGDVCLQDKLNHASLIDGARLSQSRLVRYPHADAQAAQRQAEMHGDGALMIATDGVFSMDGDGAPLPELAAIAREHQGLLYVDEAHAVGVVGPQGRGSVAAAGLGPEQVPLALVTLGKALGTYGAVVVGQDWAIEHILQTARPYIYTTALPPAIAVAALAAVKLARQDEWRRVKLAGLIERFRRGALERGLRLLDSLTPIQPVLIGDNALAVKAAHDLEARGFLVAAIRPPSVPAGSARLRITLCAAHEDRDVDALLDALEPMAAALAWHTDRGNDAVEPKGVAC
ncbi:MAG TPA: 8-amino-7-oxononanoate synthase [Xanthomonadaceae bacterium]|jgi:8-amino-7-oxononanoate synthase|nr:8-amino-7-oxononanoate synthase [Xanthomonadaceae bacterium]